MGRFDLKRNSIKLCPFMFRYVDDEAAANTRSELVNGFRILPATESSRYLLKSSRISSGIFPAFDMAYDVARIIELTD